MDLFPPQVKYPMCTIATRPRLPEHCIAWAKSVLWPKPTEEGGRADDDLDGDDPEHIKWLFEKATERATQYDIKGVTYRLTQGVVKNIIPAVASTNAVIAAACANEALKMMTGCSPKLQNYMMFNCAEGVYNAVHEQERKVDCAVCSGKPVPFNCSADLTLEAMLEELKIHPAFQLKDPSAIAKRADGSNQSLHLTFSKATEANLPKTLGELGLTNGQEVSVVDCKRNPIILKLKWD